MNRVNIIANLGSPSEMTQGAAETFMREFLSDKHILPLPFPFRNFLASRIAKKRSSAYLEALKSIAINGRSPILELTERLAKKVEERTGDKTYTAYRYGKNNLAETIEKAKKEGANGFAVIPVYPQNSIPTTQSMKVEIEKIEKLSGEKISFRQSYYDHPLYIQAVAQSIIETEDAKNESKPSATIISFHSVPIGMADVYAHECEKTTELLCEKLGRKNVLLGWQSKMGKGKWLEPSTEMLVKKIARRGIKNVTLVCPGFATDCTETLIEVGKDLKEEFLKNGGEDFTYVPCLNDSLAQVELFAKLFEEMK